MNAGLELTNEGCKCRHTHTHTALSLSLSLSLSSHFSLAHSLAHTRFTLICCQVCRQNTHSQDWAPPASSHCLPSLFFFSSGIKLQLRGNFAQIAIDIQKWEWMERRLGSRPFDSGPKPHSFRSSDNPKCIFCHVWQM